MSVCRSCGNKIIWKVTKKGKKMPVDYDAELQDDPDEEFDASRMRSHFDTCEAADDFRQSNRDKRDQQLKF